MADVPDKATLRARSSHARKIRSQDDYRVKSRHLSEWLLEFCKEHNVDVIHSFLPLTGKGEPDISTFLDTALAYRMKVIVPEVVDGQLEMRHHWYNKSTRLQSGKWGVSVPFDSDEADPSLAEIVLVPMLAVDRRGYRVGYGKGYYDYFLSRMSSVFVGVCFNDEIVDFVPNEPHDVRVLYIITEKGVQLTEL